jgi:type IV secretion system protein VirB10
MAPVDPVFTIQARTRIPLVLVNSVSTKNSQPGDRVYLQTSFPIADGTRIVIPEGSYVTGTITEVKRPGRVKGRGEIYLRFDTLMLRNGVQRDFRGTVSAVDGSQPNLTKREGKIEGDSSKGQDVTTIVGPSSTGAIIGAAADGGGGALIGAGAGAAAGMIGVLLTRGNEVQLLRGTSMEMELDRELRFALSELNFQDAPYGAPAPASIPQPGGTMQRTPGLPNVSGPFPRPY